ncbi:hypothetical protein COEREDRAFT_81387 [Coemansia reversa NRRL 1564]|uniref:Uncharacterized protein n=1 Tax=Coemansia reversa (strain ATCC 12441 / NRRL 1564) TaxID=763665 RepID=A0A2G5BAY0_COERN|nr:hypothetical protein COEREDRAFT_81387 [Coemansia reversa NRRL 1564]|eukprot:PIA16163.1 hypothetical protein COEREDRAFT_81387 [Coemansia reversa NRRL 1564]
MDHPAKTLDRLWRPQTTAPSLEDAYKEMPDMALSHDLAFPSSTETSSAIVLVAKPVVAQPMHPCLGLPANFFVPKCDEDFYQLEALYPEVTKVSVTECLHHQCKSEA